MSSVVYLLEVMTKKTVYWGFLQGEGALEKNLFAMPLSFRAFSALLMSVCQDLET